MNNKEKQCFCEKHIDQDQQNRAAEPHESRRLRSEFPKTNNTSTVFRIMTTNSCFPIADE